MKKFVGRFVSVLLAILMLLAVSGCGNTGGSSSTPAGTGGSSDKAGTDAEPADSSSKSYKFAFAVKNETNPLFINMADGVKDKVAEVGGTVNVQATESESDIDAQLQMLQTFLTQNYDAIFVTPLSSVAIVPFIKECNDAGVPIILIDTGADEDEMTKIGARPDYFVACDNKDAGICCAKAAVEELGGTGNIAILEGTPGALSGTQILEGFHEVLDGTEINIAASQSAEWNRNKGYDVTQSIITANPDLDAILASNDEMGLGAVRALKDAGLDMKVFSINNTPDGQAAVLSGDMYCTVDKASYDQGSRAVEVAMELLSGATLDNDMELLPAKLVLAEDIK
jgi:ribose transport system substrate-binding protein